MAVGMVAISEVGEIWVEAAMVVGAESKAQQSAVLIVNLQKCSGCMMNLLAWV